MTGEKWNKWGSRLVSCLGITIVLSPLLLFAAWLGGGLLSTAYPKIGYKVAAVELLPVSASDIVYFESYGFTAADFRISELKFKAWMESEERMVREIEKPVSAQTYHRYPKAFQEAGVRLPTGEEWIKISNGLYWRTPPRGNGGGTYIAFDRENGRAYFHSTPR